MALADSLKSLREVNLSDLTLDNLGSWPMAVKVYPSYQQYQDRTERKIPLVVLSPRI